MEKKREFRRWKTELRAETINGKQKIVGYAAVFNQRSEPLKIGNRSFRETVARTAFDKCLASKPDIRGLINHDPNLILGRTKSNTMSVRCDDHGLRYEIDPPKTSYATDLRESMQRGDIDASSFGFYVTDDNWTTDESGETIRELREVDCFDVSPVTFPAYSGASSGVEEVRALFPDGVPAEIRSHLELRDDGEAECECTCQECLAGDCEDCTNADCQDPNCDGHEGRASAQAGAEKRAEAKTKKVGGKDLHASDFAHVGDPEDPSTWKLPIHDASHVRNALARFNQVKGLSDDEKKSAWRKILAAAKTFGIHVSEENSSKLLATASYRDAKALLRAIDPDGDGDDDEPLIDMLTDARDGCGVVAGTASGALWIFFGGDSDYADPLLEAFVKQATVLIRDLQEAIAEANKELAEPAAGGEGSESADKEVRGRKRSTLDKINRMAELERDDISAIN